MSQLENLITIVTRLGENIFCFHFLIKSFFPYRCLPNDANHINKICSDLTTMTDALCELRQDGKGATPQAESLSRGIREKLGDLQQAVMNAVVAVDKAGLQQTAHTVQGR